MNLFLEWWKCYIISDSAFTSLWLYSVPFSCSVMSDSLQPHGLQHTGLPCPSPNPRACSNSCPSSRWCHPTIWPSVIPFSTAFKLSQHQGLFQWVSSSHQVAKALKFQLQHHGKLEIVSIVGWLGITLVKGFSFVVPIIAANSLPWVWQGCLRSKLSAG